MKILITFKDPQAIEVALGVVGIDADCPPADVQETIEKFFEYEEFVDIEIDTVKKTARVL